MSDRIIEVAKAIRSAYGEASKETDPRTYWHIKDQPWDTLPEHRKEKWLVMAKAAIHTQQRMAKQP